MPELTLDELEDRIAELRGRIRRALATGERSVAVKLRAELRRAEYTWDTALQQDEGPVPTPPAAASLLPVRDQVHQVLTVLGVPAAPKLIVTVHEALFGGELSSSKLSSLRRDEERSFRSAKHSRPFYLCAALSTDRLTAVRGLVAVSTWPMTSRLIGSLSPRVDFLTCAIRLAEHVERAGEPGPQTQRLLWRFATNIPGGSGPFHAADPQVVISAAKAELEVHEDVDRAQRAAAAERVRRQLDDAQRLFGAEPLRAVRDRPASK